MKALYVTKNMQKIVEIYDVWIVWSVPVYVWNADQTKRLIWFCNLSDRLYAGVFWLTDGKLEAVEQARKDMVHGIHELRYGKDQIPEEFR